MTSPAAARPVLAARAAVALLALALVAGCAAKTSAPTAATVPAGTVTVPALWASSDGSSSGIEPATVTATTGDAPFWAVDLATETAQGAGPAWRAASAQAAVVSTLFGVTDPAGLALSYGVTGPIDGPSAGAILTVGTVAALRGDTLDPHVTMTGTIGVDGTVGPVSAVAQKAEAAHAAGFTTLLVPVGGTPDVIPTGLDVVEVRDLPEAYALMTGEPLLAPATAPAVSPEVAAEAVRQAQGLAGVDDMAQARAEVFRRVADEATSAPDAERTPAALADRARALRAEADQFVERAIADATEGTVSAGRLAAVPAVLATAVRAAATAEGAAQWAARHTDDDDGVRLAAVVVAQAEATVRLLAPALLAVADAVPGRPADPDRAEAAVRGYATFQSDAARASRDYVVDVLHTRGTSVEDYLELAVLAHDIRTLRAAGNDTTEQPGLAGALRQQVAALAAWQAAAAGLEVLTALRRAGDAPADDVTTSGRTAVQRLLPVLAERAWTAGRDPSFAAWLDSWARSDLDAVGLETGAVSAASILATTPTDGRASASAGAGP